MQTPMTSCQIIPMQHKWNTNADDIIMTWFALYVNHVTSHLACASCRHMHGAWALYKYAGSKYLSGLVYMEANLNLGKLTASHFQVLNT